MDLDIKKLTQNQKEILKQNLMLERNKNVSWYELANADFLITDEELEQSFSQRG